MIASIEDEAIWDEVLSQLTWGMNNTVHLTTKEVPSGLLFAFSGGAAHDDLMARNSDEKRAIQDVENQQGETVDDETSTESKTQPESDKQVQIRG